uniref:DNA excision repair protein ERCC-6-like n=1 Tax=Gouania willdenowi TaxID=441366 RepID=A0A8C5E8C9_GOUWI
FMTYTADGKDAAREGNLSKALHWFRLAQSLRPSDKLEKRIVKVEELLALDNSEEEEEFVNVNNSGLMLFKELHERLYEYQRRGVSFLYGLHRDGLRGGILADDMGLGKTIQIISFLSGMYDNELVRHTLLVMPTSLITNWTKEFSKWTPGMRVKEFHGISKKERSQNLEKVQRRGGVIITTYNMLINNWEQLASYRGATFTWDYLILDEAHKIKTSTTKTAKSASAIPSQHRVLLTGTPVQNNLQELWALFNFACQGTLLGTAKTFKAEYENPITRARERDATPGEKALGSRMSENLMAVIKPYFLRRTKSEVQNIKSDAIHSLRESQEEEPGRIPPEPTRSAPKLTRKNDLIVWTHLSAVQENIYTQFLSLDHIKELLLTTRSPLAELTILKKLCDHPRLLSAGAVASLGLEESETDAQSIANVSDRTLIAESGKMVFLFQLLQRLRDEGCRTLVFAHYRKVLDIIERILNNRGFKVLRLDGTITTISERERRISLFQSDPSISVFLLTTQVGGVGITLTAANRVVIFDPSWNPATDAQAVDRAYRIGQKENVVIYRLITCGTVEEKIYRRQVFKDSLIRQNTGDKKNPFRYFSKQELKELFTLEDTKSSSTQVQLQALHARQRHTDPALDQHIADLHTMNMFGISDHDLMFSVEHVHDEPDDPEEQNYIQNRVNKARELMKAESELQLLITDGAEPAWTQQQDHGRDRTHQNRPRNPRPLSPPQERLSNDSAQSKLMENNQILQVIDLTEDELDQVSTPENRDRFQDQSLNSKDSNRTSSILLKSNSSFKHEASSRISTGLESLNGHFNLQLEDSEAMEDQEQGLMEDQEDQGLVEDQEDQGLVEAQEDHGRIEDQEDQGLVEDQLQLLSQLQMNGSFDVSKSLSERQASSDASQDNASMDESIITVKKRRAAVIYDDDEEDDEQVMMMMSQLGSSLQLIGASTPKSSSSPLRSRRSTAANISMASRRSFIQDVKKDGSTHEEVEVNNGSTRDDYSEEEEDGDDDYSEEEEDGDDNYSEEEASADLNKGNENDIKQINGSTCEEEEELNYGSTCEEEEELNYGSTCEEEEELCDGSTREEEEELNDGSTHQEEEELNDGSTHREEEEELKDGSTREEEEELNNGSTREEVENVLTRDEDDESGSADPELSSSEHVDLCTADPEQEALFQEEQGYDWLVMKGKQAHGERRLDEALRFFLRALDIQAGDPEIQLLTIRLFQQLKS